MIKLLELFGGIGACSKAFERLGIHYEIVDYVEIDKYACRSYNAIHGTHFEPQDIKEWDKDLDVDFILHGSPCQDFSIAGLQNGGDFGSKTRSSLMYETLRIVEKLRPKYVVWENVKNLISKRHIHNFNNYLKAMESFGYHNDYKVLNSKRFGIPQNRERVFVVSVLNGTGYEFPEGFDLDYTLRDFLDDVVDEKYYLSSETVDRYLYQGTTDKGRTSFDTYTIPLKRGYSVEVKKQSDEKIDDIDLIGNYSKSKYKSTMIVGDNGVSPAVRENHGQVTSIVVNDKLKPDKYQKDLDDNNPICIAGVGEKKSNNGQQWYQQNRIYNNHITLSISGSAQPYYDIDGTLLIKNNTKQGYLEGHDGDGVNISTRMKYQRGNVQKKSIQTITTYCNKDIGVIDYGLRIRKLAPRECWRLMGFDDTDFDKAEKVCSNTQLYKQAGNSIVVDVLCYIIDKLLKENNNDNI